MVLNFPSTIKTYPLLSLEDVITEIRLGNLIEAACPNGVLKLSEDESLLIFEWDSQKAAIKIDSATDEELELWIQRLMPRESEEEREERLRWEQENELRAASIDEGNAWDVFEDDIESYF